MRKQNTDADKQDNEEKIVQTTVAPEVTSKSSEYRPRGKYSARNKKSTLSPTATTASSIPNSSSERPAYKYSRKIKYTSTTLAPSVDNVEKTIIVNNDAPLKKTLLRPPLYSRKISGRNFVTSPEISVVTEVGKKPEYSVRNRITLPRTSYYSRLRNNKSLTTTTTTTTTEKNEQVTPDVAQKPTEDPDMPLIFTLLKESDQNELVSESLIKNSDASESKKPFVITISSTESGESMTANEVFDTTNERENVPVVSVTPTVIVKQDAEKYKYHANYKDQNPVVAEKVRTSSTTIPPVRNIQSRKYGKARSRKEKIEDSPNATTARSRERNINKYSEAFSKTTEASNNGVSIK